MISSINWVSLRSALFALVISAPIRTALTTWIRHYGEANGILGLGTGTLEARLAHLRRLRNEREVLLWTTPARWAGGEGLRLRLPGIGLEFSCELQPEGLRATGLELVSPDEADPRFAPGSVGALIQVAELTFALEQTADTRNSAQLVLRHFATQADQRWAGFVHQLRDAEAAALQYEHDRQALLTVGFQEAVPGDHAFTWFLRLTEPKSEKVQFDPGEPLEISSRGSRTTLAVRFLSLDEHANSMLVEVGEGAPPSPGTIRPRAHSRLLEQKRSMLDQIEHPTGDLAPLVQLVATPSLAAAPTPVEPANYLNPSIGQNRSQARAVALALGLEDGQAILVQGPPGTGKSTTAAEIICQLLQRDPSITILVCSHSNHGTDNLLLRLVEQSAGVREHVARVGAHERMSPLVRQYHVSRARDIDARSVVFTTIDSLGLRNVIGTRLYDYVILDEANRAGILDSLLALARGKRMILVGDLRQLQPVVVEDRAPTVRSEEDREAPDLSRSSLFAFLIERGFPSDASVLLDEQNRMHPDIARLVSEVFYDAHVRSGRAAPISVVRTSAITMPVCWVDTSHLGDAREQRHGTSRVNEREASLVADLARHLDQEAPPDLSLGVITTYAEQRNVLRSALGPGGIRSGRELEVDTVDAFEGREKDMIILSLVRSNIEGAVGFLRVEERLNVALSRARRMVVIIGDMQTLRGGYLDRLKDAVRNVGAVLDARDVILALQSSPR